MTPDDGIAEQILCIITMTSPWASYQIRKIAGCACAGNAGYIFSATAGYRSWQASRHVRNARAVMHAGLISGLLWRRWRGNVPGIPGACTTRNFAYLVRGSWAYKITGNWNVWSFDTNNKENFKVHITDFSEWEPACDWWIPLTKGHWRGKRFYSMTSSCLNLCCYVNQFLRS